MSYKILFGFGRAEHDFNNLVNHRLGMEKLLFGTRCAISNKWDAGELQKCPRSNAEEQARSSGAVPWSEGSSGRSRMGGHWCPTRPKCLPQSLPFLFVFSSFKSLLAPLEKPADSPGNPALPK